MIYKCIEIIRIISEHKSNSDFCHQELCNFLIWVYEYLLYATPTSFVLIEAFHYWGLSVGSDYAFDFL